MRKGVKKKFITPPVNIFLSVIFETVVLQIPSNLLQKSISFFLIATKK